MKSTSPGCHVGRAGRSDVFQPLCQLKDPVAGPFRSGLARVEGLQLPTPEVGDICVYVYMYVSVCIYV